MSDAKLPQRYDLVGEYDSYIDEVANGDYVRVEDVQPLLAEIERLRARVEVFESALRIIARLDPPQVHMTPMRRACAALGIQP